MSGSAGGRAEKDSPRREPRCAAHPTGWLVRNRRLSRDYERLTATSEAMIKVAMIRLMLVRLAGQSPRWSHEPHRKSAQSETVEDLIAA